MSEERLERKPSTMARVLKNPVSRRRFVALGGGGAAAAFLTACGGGSTGSTTSTTAEETSESEGSMGSGSETEQFGKGDVGILNYALTLEYLETAFYGEVAKSGLFKGGGPGDDQEVRLRGGRARRRP